MGMYCSRAFKTLDCETVLVSDETGAANNVVATSQKTIDQATNDKAAPDRLSSNLSGDQLKKFRSRRPMKPPIPLPMLMPINNVAALNPVRVNEDSVEAPLTMSINALPSQAPKINPTSENALTNNPRRQPDTNMKTAKTIKIRSR
jgi:hypothetical protein